MNTARMKFEVDEGNIEEAFSRIQRRAKGMFEDIARESEVFSSSDPISASKREFHRIDRDTEVEYRSTMRDLNDRERRISSSRDLSDNDKSALLNEVQAQKEQAKIDYEESKIQSTLLKEILDAIKFSAREGFIANQDEVERLVDDYRLGNYAPSSTEERMRLEEQARLIDQSSPTEENPRQWVEVMKGVLAAHVVEAVGRGANALATATDTSQVMSSLLGAVPIIGGALATASQRTLDLQTSRDIGLMDLRKLGYDVEIPTEDAWGTKMSAKDAWGTKMSAKAVSTYLASKYGTDSMGRKYMVGNDGKHYLYNEASHAYSTEADPFYTPPTIESVAEAERTARLGTISGMAMEAGSRYGVSQVDAISKFADINRSYGFATSEKAGANLGDEYLRVSHYQDVSEGQLQNVARLLRSNSAGDSISQIGYMTDHMSHLRTAENYDNMIKVASTMSSRGVTWDAGNALGIADFFTRNNSAVSMNTWSKMDTKLASSGNDFENAFQYQLYGEKMAKDGKATSLTGFYKWREKGAGDPKKINAIKDSITSKYKDTELATLIARSVLGDLTIEETEDILSGGGAKAVAKATEAQLATSKQKMLTETRVTDRTKEQAEFTNAFTESMTKGMTEVFTKVADAMAQKVRETGVLGGDTVVELFRTLTGTTSAKKNE